MTTPIAHDPRVTDERLLDEALVVVRAARERAPTDFLVALAVVLGALAAGSIVAGLAVGGTFGDLLTGLGTETLGALLTVVLIDGLWKRQATGATERLATMERRLVVRRDAGTDLSVEERRDWAAFVRDYQRLTGATGLVDRLAAARSYGQRARDLAADAERLLDATAKPDPHA